VSDKEQLIPTPFPQRVENFRQRFLPAIVWSLAAVACIWLLSGRAQRFEYIGLAQALQYEISASMTGRLDTMIVELYDHVEAGDMLVKLDDLEIKARIEQSRATIRQLTAELDAARVRLPAEQAAWASDFRRFQNDEEDRRLEVLALKALLEGDEIEEQRLALELRRSEPLLASGVIGEIRFEEIRLVHTQVRRRNEENTILLAQTEHEYRAARDRRRSFEEGLPEQPDDEPLLRPLREAITVETAVLHEIEHQRNATVLRSPIGGQVSSVFCRRGQTVVAGEPIMTISERNVSEILAYIDESDRLQVRKDMAVLVSSLTHPEQVAESFVVRLGPDFEMMPERLWLQPSSPQYGRAVVIAAVPGLDLLPGELLNVRFRSER